MAISKDYIFELVRRTDIVDLIGSYVQLKRAGRIEKGLCPFHNEKTASFCVYPDTESYYCFGCGSGGDAITFIKQIQNLDYVEAIKFLASKAGMPMPDEDDSVAKFRNKIYSINRETAHFFVNQLNSYGGKEARGYLRSRGLSDATIRGFGLGYAPDEFGALLKHMRQKDFTEEELLQAGVCKRSQKGNLYDAFRGRVIFPIIDLRGNVIAFGGRIMAEGGPKYLNSSDTPVFKKSRGLFALNIARKNPQKSFIIAEGYMDVISLHQAGFTGAVATLGTALTSEQAKLLSDYGEEVVICYDSDEAGQKATTRAISVLRNTPLKINVLNMLGAKDPDEYIKKFGPEKFKTLLRGSANTIEYSLKGIKTKYDITQPNGRAAYIKEAIKHLASSASPAEQDIYAGRIADETDVSKSAVLNQMESAVRSRRRYLAKEREKRMLNESAAASINLPYGSGDRTLGVVFAEQQLVAALIKTHGEHINMLKDKILPDSFISPEMQETYTKILSLYDSGEKYIDLPILSQDLNEKTTVMLSRILAQNHDTSFSKPDIELFMNRVISSTDSQKNHKDMSPEELNNYLSKLAKQKEK